MPEEDPERAAQLVLGLRGQAGQRALALKFSGEPPKPIDQLHPLLPHLLKDRGVGVLTPRDRRSAGHDLPFSGNSATPITALAADQEQRPRPTARACRRAWSFSRATLLLDGNGTAGDSPIEAYETLAQEEQQHRALPATRPLLCGVAEVLRSDGSRSQLRR